ncbi:hypothetical protein ACIGXM_27390 [Kitasatospora sp. NPDC052896]|uniref:hypothetical protein n=1 Tax=Kitasatospora sp. NPDC052896 TaxID=3364061 RepID=UPI0037C9045B
MVGATVCSLATLAVPLASAAPQTSGSGYLAATGLDGCSGGMETYWNNGVYNVRVTVSAAPNTGSLNYLCTGQLYRNQGGWGPLGPALTVTNGGSTSGDLYGDNGTLAYVCITELDTNITVHKPTWNHTSCTAQW